MEITLLDGGMGQELCNRSSNPIHAEWGGWVMRHEPHLVQELHQDYLRAGANVITLNAYATTPRVSADTHGQTRDFEGEQMHAIELAHAARKAAGPGARIAGTLPPLSWSYRPSLVEAFETNLADYRKIVAIQKDHVDLFICETMSTAEEARAAATAAQDGDKPVWVSWTLSEELASDGSARLRSGETIAEAIAALDGLGRRIAVQLLCARGDFGRVARACEGRAPLWSLRKCLLGQSGRIWPRRDGRGDRESD